MAEVVRKVRLTPITDYVANPHRGTCTFQHFEGDELFPGTSWSEEGPIRFPARIHVGAHPQYLPTTVSYCRWFWRAMEPEQGRFDFAMIDSAFAVCAERGQTLAVRLMAFGSAAQPQVPDWYAKKHPMQGNGQPLHDAPEYLEHWGNFVSEFARRYQAHPLLESIDITFIGPWGEGDGECSAAQCERFNALWKQAFPRTPRLALIAGEQMRVAIASGAGWRCDCYGDLSAAGSTCVLKSNSWNHTFDAYPRSIAEGRAQDAWKTAPVHFETCWVPLAWFQRGYDNEFDLDFVLEQGLKYHGTYFMPKYTALPAPWIDQLSAFSNRLGYRYIFRSATLQSPVAKGSSFQLQAWIDNVGVAPIYHRYDVAVRLRQREREEIIVLPEFDIRTWLPGDVWIDRAVKIPDGFKPGWVDVAAGLIDPATKQAKIRFAVKESFSDRWVSLGGIELD
ncbi:MAG: DUF4832 domain-containing protein [Planctomycetes bacterium]|nr:DUF4832 domain-containing protein [Planctomycetota bacterium]